MEAEGKIATSSVSCIAPRYGALLSGVFAEGAEAVFDGLGGVEGDGGLFGQDRPGHGDVGGAVVGGDVDGVEARQIGGHAVGKAVGELAAKVGGKAVGGALLAPSGLAAAVVFLSSHGGVIFLK